MGSSNQPRNSTRKTVRKARSPALPELSVIPPRIDFAIEAQRGALATSMSLLYCLHSTLHREIDHAGPDDTEAVKKASNAVHLTDITGMLMERLDSIVNALDSVNLVQAIVSPERVESGYTRRLMRVGSPHHGREDSKP
jgi:hypothetical protein